MPRKTKLNNKNYLDMQTCLRASMSARKSSQEKGMCEFLMTGS